MRRSATTRISRQNTTDTPTQFLPTTTAFTGEVRKATFSAAQPKARCATSPTTTVTFYGGWSRGFRSGGFNQTGVGEVARRERRARRPRPVPGRNRRYLRSRRQEPVPRPAAERGCGRFLHQVHQRLLLLLYRRGLDPEPGQSQCQLQGGRALNHRSARPIGSTCTRASATPTAGSPPWRIRRSSAIRRRWCRGTPINAGVQYRQPLSDGLNGDRAPGLPGDRPHLVGAVQHHLARSGVAGGSACWDCRRRSGRSPPGRRT